MITVNTAEKRHNCFPAEKRKPLEGEMLRRTSLQKCELALNEWREEESLGSHIMPVIDLLSSTLDTFE